MKKVLALLLIFIPLFAFSAEEAFFRPQSRTMIDIKEGDSFSGVIELWNIKNVSSEMIAGIEGNTFLESFYVVSLEKPKWSEDNPEVVLIEGIFILQSHLKEKEKIWTLGGLKIPIRIKEIDTKILDRKNEKFLIMDGNYEFDDSESRVFWYIGIGLLALLILLLIKKIRGKKVKLIDTEKVIDWNLKLKTAKSKEDFMALYLNRHIWIKEKNVATEDFVKLCNEYLFKKELQDFELDQLSLVRDTLTKAVS